MAVAAGLSGGLPRTDWRCAATERQFQKYDVSNLKISNARNAAQAALAIKPTEMVVLARISCMIGFSNPGKGAGRYSSLASLYPEAPFAASVGISCGMISGQSTGLSKESQRRPTIGRTQTMA